MTDGEHRAISGIKDRYPSGRREKRKRRLFIEKNVIKRKNASYVSLTMKLRYIYFRSSISKLLRMLLPSKSEMLNRDFDHKSPRQSRVLQTVSDEG
jgi:hypothetical protein